MLAKAICPSCGEWVKLSDNPKMGQKITCPECEADLEVIEVNPIELDWAFMEGKLDDEDWEDDEDWDNAEEWDDEEEEEEP
jgi:lysine biosynthesis protein LysW